MSTVDVIVPCYNYARYLRTCVNSALSQSRVDVRVLVIDDASSDETAQVGQELAASDNRVEFRRHQVNKGHIATYNEGITWADADYMLLLSADDYLLSDTLHHSAELMDAHPEVGFTFGEAIVLEDGRQPENPDGHPGKVQACILTGREFVQSSGARNIVPTPTAVVRTELQKRVGGYRPELPHSGDMEMWLRLAAHASVGVVELCQAVYRRHTANMSLNYNNAEGSLPDLEQRKAALDCFIQQCSFAFPDAHQLHRKLLWSLGCEAIGVSSAAFNDGNTAVSERLSQFAFRVCPEITRSLPWLALACKRQMPSWAWRAIQPSASGVRYLASSLKQLSTSLHKFSLSFIRRSA